MIRETDPPKPSTRISTRHAEAELPATARRTSPGGLARGLRGDLDWITMRAMEKEPRRRYATAAQLAQDIQRHLDHEPVAAGPPSVAYRVRKLVRKRRGLVIGSGAVAAALLISALVVRSILDDEHQRSIEETSVATRHYARWAEAVSAGEEPDPADERAVRGYVDDVTYSWLRDQAASPAAFADFTRRVLDRVRGEEEWLFPDDDALVADPITFRVHGMPEDREPDSPVTVRIGAADADEWQHAFEVPASGVTRDLEFSLPQGVVLEMSDERESSPQTWQIVLTLSGGRQVERRVASFALVPRAARARALARIRATGDASLDRVLRAAALVAAGLPQDAARELEPPLPNGAGDVLVRMRRQLRVRALAVVDRARARRLLETQTRVSNDR